MSTTSKAGEETGKAASRTLTHSLIPFTGGLFVVYAFFWPEGYGKWLGTIVHAFRTASGI